MPRRNTPENMEQTNDPGTTNFSRRQSITLRGQIPSTSGYPTKRTFPLRPKIRPPLKKEEDYFDESIDQSRNTLFGVGPENNTPAPPTEKSSKPGSTMRPLPLGQSPESDDSPLVTIEEVYEKDDVGDVDDDVGDSEYPARNTETDLFTADPFQTAIKTVKSKRKRKISMPSMKAGDVRHESDEENPKTQKLHAPNSRQDVFAFFAGGFNAMRNEEFNTEGSKLELLRDLTRLDALITINYFRLAGEEHYLPFLRVDSTGKLIIEIVASWKSTLQGLTERVNEMIQMVGYINSLPPEIQENNSMVNDTLKLFFLYLEAVINAKTFDKPDFTSLSSCSDDAFDGISSITFMASPELVEACKDQVYAEFESEYKWLKLKGRAWLEDENATNATQLNYGGDFKTRCINLIDEKIAKMNIALMDLGRNKHPEEEMGTIFANEDRATEFARAVLGIDREDRIAQITSRNGPIANAFDKLWE